MCVLRKISVFEIPLFYNDRNLDLKNVKNFLFRLMKNENEKKKMKKKF